MQINKWKYYNVLENDITGLLFHIQGKWIKISWKAPEIIGKLNPWTDLVYAAITTIAIQQKRQTLVLCATSKQFTLIEWELQRCMSVLIVQQHHPRQ